MFAHSKLNLQRLHREVKAGAVNFVKVWLTTKFLPFTQQWKSLILSMEVHTVSPNQMANTQMMPITAARLTAASAPTRNGLSKHNTGVCPKGMLLAGED
jgi:hypothetical protein